MFSQLHQLVKPEGVGETVDRVELAGDEYALQNLVIVQPLGSERIYVFIHDPVGVLSQLRAEAQ